MFICFWISLRQAPPSILPSVFLWIFVPSSILSLYPFSLINFPVFHFLLYAHSHLAPSSSFLSATPVTHQSYVLCHSTSVNPSLKLHPPPYSTPPYATPLDWHTGPDLLPFPFSKFSQPLPETPHPQPTTPFPPPDLVTARCGLPTVTALKHNSKPFSLSLAEILLRLRRREWEGSSSPLKPRPFEPSFVSRLSSCEISSKTGGYLTSQRSCCAVVRLVVQINYSNVVM